MNTRRVTALVTSVLVALAALVAVSPASATPDSVPHGNVYAPYAGTDYAGSGPVVAINAAGDRALSVFLPVGANGCDPGHSNIEVRGGTVGNSYTLWSDTPVLAEVTPGENCGVPMHLKVFLSDDGTLGMISWMTANSDFSFTPRVARVSWPLNAANPSVINNSWAESFTSAFSWPSTMKVAMSSDGSRAVAMWREFDVDTAVFGYGVIDLANPSSTTTQHLPDSYTINMHHSDVAISDDGAIVALGASATPDSTAESSYAFRTAKVYVCSHNCYASRLKTYSMTAPAQKGPMGAINLTMSRNGGVIAAAWNTDTFSTALVAFSPTARGGAVDLSTKVKYFPSISISGNHHMAMNDAGTKIALTCELGTCLTNHIDVVTASISNKLVISGVKATIVSPPYYDELTDVTQLSFIAQSGSAPERLALVVLNNMTQTMDLLIANDASAPSFWSIVWTRQAADAGWLDPYSAAFASDGSRFIVASQSQFFNGVSYIYDARVVVDNTQTTVGVKKLPAISGSLKVGNILSASKGTFLGLPAGATYEYNWLRDGIFVATGRTYALTQEDAGSTIQVMVRVSTSSSYQVTVISAESAIVKGGVLTVPTVTISGTAAVGSELQAQTSGSSTPGVSVSYTWKRGSSTVGELSSYTPTNADAGKSLTLVARFYKNGFTDKK
ncbi:MAG: hypothetical protein RLZZ600_1192, partial [Actinomycetota bacterium]